MTIEAWEAALGAAATATAAFGGGFWSRRSRGEKDASSAIMLTKAYGELIDDQRTFLDDARAHIHRQDEELKALRDELRDVRGSRDTELNALRLELATVRTENVGLRDRIATIESRERRTDH